MNVHEIMRYIESEYIIINNTPCNICGGKFITESYGFEFDSGIPANVTNCICEDCGNRKDFHFRAPMTGFNIQEDSPELN